MLARHERTTAKTTTQQANGGDGLSKPQPGSGTDLGGQFDERQVEHPVGEDRPGTAACDLGGYVGGDISGGQATKDPVGEDTTGLTWAPETGPKVRMLAMSPTAVAAAFSNSCSPMSLGERRWAVIPEPMTIAARNAEPRSSTSAPRHKAGRAAWVLPEGGKGSATAADFRHQA